MLNTEMLGDPSACRQTGEWMVGVATSTLDTATVLRGVRDRTEACWRGDAARGFQEHIGRGDREGDQISGETERAGNAMIVFSDELDTVEARLDQARGVAAEGGLTVTPQGIEPPQPVTLPAAPTTALQSAATEAYQAQLRAWNEVNQTVGEARGIERAAHERLGAATNTPKSVWESIRSGAGFAATGAAIGAAEGLHRQNSRFRNLSARHARESLDITRRIANSPALSESARTSLQSSRNDLLDRAAKENRIAHNQARLLGGLDRTGGGRFLLDVISEHPGSRIPDGGGLFQRGASRVLGKIPYVGAGVTVAQTAVDIHGGKPADQAIASAAISTGVGAGVTGTMLALAPLAIAGGPFTLAAVGVGAVAAWGAGYVVDHHWDDMKDFAGDAGGAVVDGAKKVGDWLGF